jgi:hypothetical protein
LRCSNIDQDFAKGEKEEGRGKGRRKKREEGRDEERRGKREGQKGERRREKAKSNTHTRPPTICALLFVKG